VSQGRILAELGVRRSNRGCEMGRLPQSNAIRYCSEARCFGLESRCSVVVGELQKCWTTLWAIL